MNSTQLFFIQVLKDHLTHTATIPAIEIDWKEIILYAHIHEVEGIIYYQCKDFMPNDAHALLHRKFCAALFHYKNIETEYHTTVKLLKDAGILSFAVKGLEIAAYYPVPALRTMGDLDIVVPRKEKKNAGIILETQGYLSDEKAPDFDWHYKKGNITIELHHQLLYNEVSSDSRQCAFFNHYDDFVKAGNLDINFHFIFLIAHLRKHLLNSGVGFRMFMDIDAVVRYEPKLDWTWIGEKLEFLGMKKFSMVCFSLCEKWFGASFPFELIPLEDNFLEYASQTVFSNGIFGGTNIRNQNNTIIGAILKRGKSRRLSRFILVLKHIFPEYMHLRYQPQYRFVEGRPWLVPAAWSYRFFRFLAGKTSPISNYMEKVNLPDSEVDAREKELKMWGLIQ